MLNYSKLFQNESSGNDIFDALDLKIRNLRSQGIEIIDFGVGDPAKTLGIPEILVSQFNTNYEQFAKLGYPGNKGDEDFVQEARKYLKNDHHVDINSNEIIISNGAKTAVSLISRIFLDPRDLMICPSPAYPNFSIGAKLFSSDVYLIPLLKENNFLIDFKSIPIAIANKAKCIWINYPNSPSGALAPKNYLVELIEWCHKYNIVLLSDEAYIDIYYDKPQLTPLSITKEGVLSFYSLSKSFNMTNCRIGFVAGDEKIISKAHRLFNMYSDGVSSLIQKFGAIALQNSNSILPQMRLEYSMKARLLKDAFIKCFNCPEAHHSQGSIFLWQEVPNDFDDISFCDFLLKKSMAVMPGIAFSPNGKKFVRIALIQPLERVQEIIKKFEA